MLEATNLPFLGFQGRNRCEHRDVPELPSLRGRQMSTSDTVKELKRRLEEGRGVQLLGGGPQEPAMVCQGHRWRING